VVDKVDSETPHRNKLEIPRFSTGIVGGTSFTATAAVALRTCSGANIDVYGFTDEVNGCINKIPDWVASIEQSFDLHDLYLVPNF
jgi:hypothetical protein